MKRMGVGGYVGLEGAVTENSNSKWTTGNF